MDRLALLDRIRRVPVLCKLALGDLDALVSRCAMRSFAPGAALMREGARGDGVFVVIEGRVGIQKSIGAEETRLLALRGPGDWIGEMALIDDGPRSATAIAQDAVVAMWIERDDFLATIKNGQAASDLLRTLVERLRESDDLTIEALRGKAEMLAARNDELETENRRLLGELEERHGFECFVGSSAAARRVRAQARRAAEHGLPVLVLGETGTGKEIIARAVHAGSACAKGRFVAVNCALLTETLLESELFGHARGAFTGAVATRSGLVEAAGGGTLFLDEIADMPLALQGALLRFLELGEYRRLGDTRSRHADVRVIAATHADLEAQVRRGRFRRDLFYRLDVLRVTIPPLRERREDLPELVASISARTASRLGRRRLELSASMLATLAQHDFPGNVRELENIIDRLYALGPEGGPPVEESLLRCLPTSGGDMPRGYAEAVRQFKIGLIGRALVDAGGNRSRAARLLGLHRPNLVRMVRELGIDHEADDDDADA